MKLKRVRTRQRGKTWSYIFEAGKDENGKRKVIEKGGFPTEQSAYEAGTEAYTSYIHGNIGVSSSKILLYNYMDLWLKSIEPNVGASTIYNYEKAMKTIKKHLHNKFLQELTPKDVDNMVKSMFLSNLAYTTIQSYKKVLGNALNYAIYPCELISYNPAHLIKIPAKARKNVKSRAIVTKDVFKSLIEKYCLPSHFYIIFMLLYHTGMRIGEVLGLEWDNIDLDKKVIHIVQQQKELDNSITLIGPLKSKLSKRDIFFGQTLHEALTKWKKAQDLNKSKRKEGYVVQYTIPHKDDESRIEQVSINVTKYINVSEDMLRNFVCTQKNGRFVHHQTVDDILQKLGITTHSFRHTHCTILMENGATPKEVAARLGHTVDMTNNIYSHVTEIMQERTAELFEQLLSLKPTD